VLTEAANMLTSSSYTFVATGGTINFAIIKVGVTTTDVKVVEKTIPSVFQLQQNYPNPFNPTTKINYAVKELSHVRIAVYNILGQEVATLVNSELAAGRYTIDWNGMNSNSEALSTGLYFYQMTAHNFVETKKMMFVK
jgi:flagellar hook assembly protein FlgD